MLIKEQENFPSAENYITRGKEKAVRNARIIKTALWLALNFARLK